MANLWDDLEKQLLNPEKPNAPGVLSDIKRATGQFVSGVGSTLRDIGAEGIGAGIEKYGTGIALRNPSQIKNFNDILENPLTTLREAVSEVVPQVGLAVGGQLAGRAIGGLLGAPLGPLGVIGGQQVGGVVGGLLPIAAQTYGGIRSEQRAQGIEDIPRAIGATVPSAALERFGGAERIAGKIAGQGTEFLAREAGQRLLPSVGRQFARGGLEEAITEVPQTALERFGAYKPLAGQEAMDEYAVAGVKAFLGGGAVRGGLSAVAGPRGLEQQQQPTDLISGTPETPEQPILGLTYSPLAGTPVVFPDGTVALGSEQELTKRYNLPQAATAVEQDIIAPTGAAPTRPGRLGVFDERDTALLNQGVKPTKRTRELYDTMVAAGFDLESDDAVNVFASMAQNKLGDARRQIASVVASRNAPAVATPVVSPPSGAPAVSAPAAPAAAGVSLPITTAAPAAPAPAPVVRPQPPAPLVDTSDEALETARATGNQALVAEIEAQRGEAEGTRVDAEDLTDAQLNAIVQRRFTKSKNPQRDAQILSAYLTALRSAPKGSSVAVQEAIGRQFGIGAQAVRKIGNPSALVAAGKEMGYSTEQVLNVLNVDDNTKAQFTQIGQLESRIKDLRKQYASATGEAKTAIANQMARANEEIQRAKEAAEQERRAAFSAGLQEAGVETAEGDTAGFGFDTDREWAKLESSGEATTQIMQLADARDALRQALEEFQQVGNEAAIAEVAQRIADIDAQLEKVIADASKPKAKAAEKKPKKAKTVAAETAAEEKDAAKEAEAAKLRAERAAKLQADRNGLAVGDTVKNPKLGTGVVKSFAGDGDSTTVTVAFQSGQTKELSVKLAKLEKVDAVQVQSAAGVPVQPEARAGQEVGRQVRRAEEPAAQGQAQGQVAVRTTQEQYQALTAGFEAPAFDKLTDSQQKQIADLAGRDQLNLAALNRILGEQKQRVEYPSTAGQENAPAYLVPAQRAVVDFMNGDITREELRQRFADLKMTVGQQRSVVNRIEWTGEDIDAVKALIEAGPERPAFVRKSRRSVRTADQSGTVFESVEASLEDLSGYSEGIDGAIRSLRNSGMGNAVDAIDSWMVTFSPVDWDAIYTIVDGKRTIIYNGLILKDRELAAVATLHEIGHGVDAVQSGTGSFSSNSSMRVQKVNGEPMAMRPGTVMDELLNHFEDNSELTGLGALLNYPLDMSDKKNRSLTVQELREEVFAQVWAFSNMNGGMDFLRENLPATFAFMESVHAQVKATNYKAAAQGAQQGLEPRQVQAGTQAAPAAVQVSRASRQARQGLIDRNINRLPQQLRQPANNIVGALGDLMGRGLDYVVFTSDLVGRAVQAGMPAAQRFATALANSKSAASERERRIEKIADMFATIEDEHKGSGAGSVNEFLFESTRTGKWGYPNGKFKADPEMAAMFNALKPKAQAFVKAVFQHGDTMLSEKKKIVLDAANSEYDAMIAIAKRDGDKDAEAKLKAEKVATLKRFDTLFKIREGLPYAPIKRTGSWAVVSRSPEYEDAIKAGDTKRIRELEQNPEHYQVSFVDSKWEARNLQAKIDQEFAGLNTAIVKRAEAMDDFSGKALLPALTSLRSKVDAERGTANTKVHNIISQLYLEALAEDSARKSEMRRRGISGEVDMLASFTTQGRADANFLAAVQYSPEIQDALQQMRSQSKTGDVTRKTELFDEISSRYTQSLDYNTNPWVDKLTGLSSKYFLATSPGYYIQNLTQPFMMSVPAMAGRHDYAKVGQAMWKAYSELGPLFKNTKLFDQQFDFTQVPADVRAAVDELVKRGKIDIGLATEINEFKVDADNKLSQFAQRLNKGMRMAVQKAEAINRLSTAMAAYRLELARTKSQEQAIAYADRILTETHGDYTAFNAPRIFNTNFGKIALQFRKFQLIQIGFYAKLLRDAFTNPAERAAALRTLGYSLAHSGVFAGALGLPGYAAVAALAGFLFGDEDEPYDLTEEMRKALGPEWSQLIMRGVPTLAGVDLSGKIGAGQMLSIAPFADIDLTTQAGVTQAIGTIAGGAAGGMTARMLDGLGLIMNGDIYRGTEQVMPKGIGDMLKAGRIAGEGLTRRNGDVILGPDDVSQVGQLFAAIGLPSAKVTENYQARQSALDLEKNFTERATKVKNQYARAFRERDAEGMAEARDAWMKLQAARRRNDLKPQPLSSLLKAPQEQRKREQKIAEQID